MNNPPTSWLFPENFVEAAAVQRIMAESVLVQDDFPPLKKIVGLDVSCNFRDPQKMIYAAAVMFDADTLQVIEKTGVAEQQNFPYKTGFLGFREAPALMNACKKLSATADIMMVDGHGLCHPRGLGIASHLGVLCNVPTIGVGKTILIGKPAAELAPDVGATTPLIWKGKEVAMLVRTRARARPLIISAGHRISLKTAVQLVLQSLRGYRLPEPTRQAHLAANELRLRLMHPFPT